MPKKMATTCRLQELLKRPIFPSVGLLSPQTVNFANAESINPHLSQILANSEQRLNVSHQRLHAQNQNHSHHTQLPSHLPTSQVQQAKRRYACSQCPYSTDRRDLFRRHENIHRDEKPFRCYVCNKMFNRADHVKKHFLRIHKGLEYDVKLTKRIKGVDYDVKETIESNCVNGNSNSSIIVNNNNSCSNINSPITANLTNGSNTHNNHNKCFPVFSSPYSFANAIQFAAINLKEDQIFKVAPEPLPEHEVPIVILKESDEILSRVEPEPEAELDREPEPEPESEAEPEIEANGELEKDALEGNTVEYECEFCGCAFLNYPSLHTHRYLLHRYVTESDNFYLYRCVICGQKSITQKAMIQHMLRHSTGSKNKDSSKSKSSSSSCRNGNSSASNGPDGSCHVIKPSELIKPKSKWNHCLTVASNLSTSRRKQSQPKKIVKSTVNVNDLLEIEKCDKVWLSSKFSCKICHKHFSTYTQQIQHQMFFKHYQ